VCILNKEYITTKQMYYIFKYITTYILYVIYFQVLMIYFTVGNGPYIIFIILNKVEF